MHTRLDFEIRIQTKIFFPGVTTFWGKYESVGLKILRLNIKRAILSLWVKEDFIFSFFAR